MSLFNLKKIKNHPRRSGFDLSSKVAFTAKVGELLPVKTIMCLPGDSFELKVEAFTRTQPINTSAYTRIREYYDWYFVPLRLLWKNAPAALSQMVANPQSAVNNLHPLRVGNYLPTISLNDISDSLGFLKSSGSNEVGFDRAACSYKLLQYLRYGNCNKSSTNLGTSSSTLSQSFQEDFTVSMFPLLAYQKIYSDYFRNTQWETSEPYTYNIDYFDGTSKGSFALTSAVSSQHTYFDLRYCNYPKDMFMGVLPDSQYGATSSVNLVNISNDNLIGVNPSTTTSSGQTINQYKNGSLQSWQSGIQSLGFDVLALRKAEALQRWKEVSLNNSQNYRSQIKAHYGVDVGEYASGMAIYVGGTTGNIGISEVTNQNLSADNVASIAGKGVGSSNGFDKFKADDFGVLMCIYHAVPLIDYVLNSPDVQYHLNLVTDYPIPELDSIGMESLPFTYFDNTVAGASGKIMGYLPRYYAFKTSNDYVLGAFTTTEKEWVAPYHINMFAQNWTGGYANFKVNPSILNSIFVADVDENWDTDQLLINSFYDVKVVRNLDYSGLPF